MKDTYLKYKALFVVSLLSVAVTPFFLSSGGTAPDSLSYFKLTEDLPEINANLFPIGYPLLLNLPNYFVDDYFYSSKILNVFGIIFIGIFSYYKKFYFRETVILLTFRVFLNIYPYSYSESVFLTLLYFLVYYFHEYFTGKIYGLRFIVPASLLAIYLVMIRYSGVYIYIATGIYFLFFVLRNKNIPSVFKKDYFCFLGLSALGIGGYLLFNYYHFGGFFGENIRSKPDIDNFWHFTYENLLGVINIVNPIFSFKILQIKNIYALWMEIIIIALDLLFLVYFIFYYIRYFKNKITPFHQLLLTVGISYMLFMFISEYTQSIELLNTRMLCESSFVLFFSFLLLYYENFPEKVKNMFLIGCISLFCNIVYLVKIPENYLHNRSMVKKILQNKKEAGYFYDDTKNEKKVSIYKIPFINKTLEYAHPYLQSGQVNLNIIRTLNPHIQAIKDDGLIDDKSKIIYNSEIK
ncbi:MAG: hypothetical protein LBP34_09160 [Flavobacteriaceae bacterium]|jgi:hypothetical protein|nr:hypothetical protein [Flavobacteriaceae bacterium]